MNNPWKLILLLAGIFLAGGTSGALLVMRMRPLPQNRPVPAAEVWTSLHLNRIASEVGLQPGQLDAIEPIVKRHMLELFQMRGQYLDRNHAVRETMEREVAEKMTPEQRAKYDAMNREFHERSRRLERGERLPPRDR